MSEPLALIIEDDRDTADFLAEAAQSFGRYGIATQDLERDGAMGALLDSFVDHAHATLADLAHDGVLTDPLRQARRDELDVVFAPRVEELLCTAVEIEHGSDLLSQFRVVAALGVEKRTALALGLLAASGCAAGSATDPLPAVPLKGRWHRVA